MMLNQRHNAVIDDTDVFSFYALIHLLDALFFNGPDPGCFDIDLIRQGGQSQYPPGGTIILVFSKEDLFAALYDSIVLDEAMLHRTLI